MTYEKRTSGAQLPSAEELIDILAKESPRLALRYDFVETNSSIFDVHREISSLAGSDDGWITSYRQLDLDKLVEKIQTNHQAVINFIKIHPEHADLYERLYASLSPQQDLSPSESLFVFGASSNARIDRAVELYRQGISNKIIISGQQPHYSLGDESEAVRMGSVAKEAGIPESALLIEQKAITIPDNVKRTIDLLISMNWKPTSITIIATDFVLSRAKMEWYKFTPWNIDIRVVAAHAQSPNFTKEGWYKDDKTIALVLNEYAKIILETKIDLLK
ncbi:MAG TPA: YdcF family protein [Candidatus Microsaccharimonas sp.]|jgi:hypothetical protein